MTGCFSGSSPSRHFECGEDPGDEVTPNGFIPREFFTRYSASVSCPSNLVPMLSPFLLRKMSVSSCPQHSTREREGDRRSERAKICSNTEVFSTGYQKQLGFALVLHSDCVL